MFVTRKALPRRTVLRGLGATVALPVLDAMTPALSAAPAANAMRRFGVFYSPNGMFPSSFHPVGNGGTDFELTPVLTPLKPLRSEMVVISGLSNLAMLSESDGGAPHTRANSAWLSGVRPKRTQAADILGGKTVDQFVADELGEGTPLRSLELTSEDSSLVGVCDNGYACAYVNAIAWRTPTLPLLPEGHPRIVFERLFGTGSTASERRLQMHRDRSMLDFVREEMHGLEKQLGVADRTTVGEYLDAVRDVEVRIQRTENTSQTSFPENLGRPDRIPDDYDEHMSVLLDLLFLAYRADVTRVSTVQMGREMNNRAYPNAGVPEAHHDCSHHQNDPYKIQQYTKCCAYHMTIFSRFAEKMRATPEGDGTMLDHTLLLYGCGLGDGNQHSPFNIPTVLVGGANGHLKGGRHLLYPEKTPVINVGLSILEKLEIEGIDRIGDSTGPLAGL